jgi:hypothetical protein
MKNVVKVGEINISLYKIAIGPKNYDFKIKKLDNRLSFNITMTQILDIRLNVQDVYCQLFKDLNDVNYLFNFILMVILKDRFFQKRISL